MAWNKPRDEHAVQRVYSEPGAGVGGADTLPRRLHQLSAVSASAARAPPASAHFTGGRPRAYRPVKWSSRDDVRRTFGPGVAAPLPGPSAACPVRTP
ncbi:hypothetical protein CSOJ01_07271 [Colletotrichum sojae]|uniref:Uncharacterized protein n=1 Tax=Colletotrichum sojae TaxID=2175907 RepID=A0A8H6MTX0_9PEZI|nr:hypothetical protein CSOJ01_07271 [Colletotrichum sojae]